MTEQEKFASKQDVSRETIERLQVYEDLLKKWTSKINLVAKSTVPEVWTRHFLDSAQVFSVIPGDARVLVDFGSGGGFPGLVIAAIAAEKMPSLSISLVEADIRKASFLVTAAREMNLDVRVHAERVEAIPAYGADVITARALAPLVDLFAMAEQHLHSGGTALFLKGAQHQAELDNASHMWNFHVTKLQSATNDASALLKITDLKRAE
jgi:16S rRNA (guanine527-N7)-methyltransferase